MGGRAAALNSLAELLTVEDEVMQWGFVGIALKVLAEAYVGELESSFQENPSTPEGRKRLIGWQRATDGFITLLNGAITRLDDGAAFSFFVDRLRRIVVSIDEQVVLVIPPPGVHKAAFAGDIIEQFCAYNDCVWLGLKTAEDDDDPGAMGRGQWAQSQNRRIRYEVDEQFWFEFDGFANRRLKASISDQAVDELDRLAEAFDQADVLGHPIDWSLIARTPPSSGAENIVLNSGGGYLSVRLPILARLRPSDWSRVVHWMQQGGWGRGDLERPLIIRRGEALLPAR